MRSASRRPTSWPSCVERMRDIATFVAVAVLVSAGPVVAAAIPDDPKAVAYEALTSLLLGNAEAFVRVTLPVEGVQAILRPTPPSGDERARIDEQLSRVRLSTRLRPLFEGEPVDDGKAPPVGTRIVYLTQLGGSLVPVVVVRSAAGCESRGRHAAEVDGAWKVLPEPYFEWLRSMGAI